MWIDENFFWIGLTALCIAIPCSILGSFLIFRKLSMLGDAISHAVLPGLVVAYLLTQNTQSLWMLLLATAFGACFAVLMEFTTRKLSIQSDAVMGIYFTLLFAIGIVLIAGFNDNLDIDQDCVLFGEIAFIPLETLSLFSYEIPQAFLFSVFAMVVVLVVVRIFFPVLMLSCFDYSFGISLGLGIGAVHYILVGMVSMVSVFSFEAIGAILVLSFLVVPAATGYMLSHRFRNIILIAQVVNIISICLGYYIAYRWNASISGAIATCMGICFLAGWIVQRIQKRTQKKAILETI